MATTDTDRQPARDQRPWRPLAGDALLDRLRFTGRRRPPVDPDLARRLRARLEDGVTAEEGGVGPGVPVVVTKARLAGALDGVATLGQGDRQDPVPSPALACGALVDTLFRQLVTVGTIGDPMTDGLAGLEVDGHHGELLVWIDRMPPADRTELEGEVTRQALGMQERWPVLDPGWLPRTRQRMRVPLLGGRVELVTRVDLAIGRPAVAEASVALVEVRSGDHRPVHRAELHYDALVETLRTGAPPFVVATYATRTGELDAEPVTEQLLEEAVERTAAGAVLLCRSMRPAAPARLGGPVPGRPVSPPFGAVPAPPGPDTVSDERRAA
jgi:hypothetical protein